jgi:hypothetical protein
VSEWVFIGAAYGLTWLTLGGYALYLRARTRRARAELAAAEVGR